MPLLELSESGGYRASREGGFGTDGSRSKKEGKLGIMKLPVFEPHDINQADRLGHPASCCPFGFRQ
jgi:hypothetical protein